MDSIDVAFGVAGIVGATVSVLVAVTPTLREWYYDRRNIPLKVEPIPPVTKVNPGFGGRLRFKVRNRIRSAVSVQISPQTHVTVTTDASGKTEAKGTLFDNPEPRIYPSGELAWTFWLPGHDTREIELRLPVTQGILRGTETVRPVVFANRFRAQEIHLGPYEFEVDPKYH